MSLPDRVRLEALRADPELAAWFLEQLGIAPVVAGLLRREPDAPLPGGEVDGGRERLEALRQRQIDDLDTLERKPGGLIGPHWNGAGTPNG